MTNERSKTSGAGKTKPGRNSSGRKKEKYTFGTFIKDFLEVVIPAILLFLVIHTFFLEARFVPTPSMVPTIEVQDRFLSNKTAYWASKPDRYQIVVFKPPAEAGSKDDFVKRIIGLPNEKIEIRGGIVYIDDLPLEETYITPERAPVADFPAYIIPEDHVFMMGDNRNNSQDSRFWGPLPIKNIKGRAWFRFWPLNRIGLVK